MNKKEKAFSAERLNVLESSMVCPLVLAEDDALACCWPARSLTKVTLCKGISICVE